MKFSGDTVDKRGQWDDLLSELRHADSAYVDTGIFEGEDNPKSGSDYTVAQYGAVQEFGYSEKFGRSGGEMIIIPPRSFLRSTMDENNKKFGELFDSMMWDALLGNGSVFGKLTVFGEILSSAVRKKITDLKSPPLAASTIKRKGSSNPLIDFGYLRASIRSLIIVGSRNKKTNKGPVSKS